MNNDGKIHLRPPTAFMWAMAYKEKENARRLAEGIDRYATPEMESLICEIAERKSLIKGLEEEVAALTQKFKDEFDDGKVESFLVERDGRTYVAARFQNPPRRFDMPRFRKEAPGLYERYTKLPESGKRQFCTYASVLKEGHVLTEEGKKGGMG